LSKKKTKNSSPFGKLLSRLRKKNGLTMSAVAKAVNVSESYISLLESGERNQPSRELVLKLAQILGAKSNNNLADDFLVTAGYYPSNKQTYYSHEHTLNSYKHQIQKDPHDFNHYSALIFALIKLGKTQEAQTLIQKGMTQFEQTAQLQSLLASLELAKGNFQQAIELQTFALQQQEQNPSDTAAESERFCLNLGVMHFLKGLHHDQAAMNARYSNDPETAQSLKTEAVLHFKQSKELFQELLVNNPNNIYIRDEFARVCFNLAHQFAADEAKAKEFWQASIDSFKQIIHAEDKFSLGQETILESCLFLAHAYSKTQDYDTAETLLNTIEIAISSPNWMVPYLKACFYILRSEQGNNILELDKALYYLELAKKISPNTVCKTALLDPDLDFLRKHKNTQFKQIFNL
jgi:transcriptional regulator with XRE-family HTH domain